MSYQMFLNPWVIALGVGVAGGIALVFWLVRSAGAVGENLKTFRKQICTRAGFFWTVNLVFMAVSVLHAGVFFGITGNGHDVPGLGQVIGFAVSFFLDLVTIILMQALLEARYRGEENRARQLLLFIVVCCGTSTFANLAISLNDFDAVTMLPHAPGWVQGAAPYVLASFPLFVIMMAVASEMIVNVRPMDSLNEQEYEADEEKRVNILQIRNTYLQKQADEDLRTLTIRAQMRANKAMRKGNVSGSFRWPWEKALQIDLVVAGVVKQLESLHETKVAALSKQNEQLLERVESQISSSATYAQSLESLYGSTLETLSQRNEQFLDEVKTQLSSRLEQAQSIESLCESKVVALSQHNEQFLERVKVQLSSTLEQAQSVESLCESKVVVLSQQNGQLLEQVKTLMSDTLGKVQSLAYGDGVEEENAVATPYSEELVKDIQGLLANYPILLSWLSTGQRSATIEEIVKVTGHTLRMVKNRVDDRTLVRTKRLGSYRVDSVVRWLKTAPLPKVKDRDTTASIPVINVQNGGNGHSKDTIKLDQLEEVQV